MKEEKRLSHLQVDIFNIYDTTLHNLVINSVAGSGKSYMLHEIAKRKETETMMLAFNKTIANELKEKTKSLHHVEASTIHSLGMKSLAAHYRKDLTIDNNKIWKIGQKLNDGKWKLSRPEFLKNLGKLIQPFNIYRLTLQSESSLQEMCDEYGFALKKADRNRLIDLAKGYHTYNKKMLKLVDFTDMIYIPATNSDIKIKTNCKLLLIDECQDLNACQHKFVDKIIGQNNARWIAVGDPYQSIYHFAGAHSKSFDLFLNKDNVKEMPLSICYRCPKEVVKQSNQIYNIMNAYEHAIDGRVEEDGDIDMIEEGDMVLCRNVKPLIQLYFKLIKRRKKVFIRGIDMMQNLVRFLKPYRYLTIEATLTKLKLELDQIVSELIERDIDEPKNHPSYTKLDEKRDLIKSMENQFKTTKQFIDFLQEIFTDEKKGVILSTIHKAKGLEEQNVFFLQPSLIPSRYSVTEDQKKQEENLRYVATSRSQKRLTYINQF